MNDLTAASMVEIRAELLSMVTKADGKIRDIENVTAETILERSGSLHEEFAKDLYNWSVKTSLEHEEQENIFAKLSLLPASEKVDLINSLWAVAASDGEIHVNEQTMIKEMMAVMGVDDSMVSAGSGV